MHSIIFSYFILFSSTSHYRYIKYSLVEPTIANKYSILINEEIEKLAYNPHRFAVVDIKVKNYSKIYKLIIKNYIVFYRISENNKIVNITPKEFEILTYLIKNKNIAISREQLLSNIWGYDYFGDDRTVDTHIKMLRNNLGVITLSQ